VCFAYVLYQTKPRRQPITVGVAILACAFATNPYYGTSALRTLLAQSKAFPGGDTYAFSFTKAIVPVLFGLVPYPLPNNGGFLSKLYIYVAFFLALGLVGLILAYVIRSAREESRIILLSLAATGLLAAYLGLWMHYSYGFFKVILYGGFLVLTAVAVAALDLWNNSWKPLGPSPAKFLAATAIVVIALYNIGSSTWYGVASLGVTNRGVVNETGLSDDPSFDQLQELEHIIGPRESVMIDTGRGVVQMWAAYGLRRVRVSLIQPLLYFEPWTRDGSVNFTHNYTDEYVLRETGNYQDIIAEHFSDAPIWRSRRFELRRLQDYTALGGNWHGLEGSAQNPWRWLNNDGELLLIHPTDSRYQISFQMWPGPGRKEQTLHVVVVANGHTVHEQVANGAAEISTPLFGVQPGVNRILIRTI
jgi:hypothetical protein